ncbi:MAG: hypothetical protein GY938_09710, partial [Ketobacter sp.]|nr:hypothetical protein [Ketobacter sp.]
MKSNLVLSAHDDEDLIAKTWAIVKYRNAFSVSEEQMFAHFTVENKHLKDPLRTYYLNLVNAQATDCPTTLNELILCAFGIWDWNPTYKKLNREFQSLKMKEGTKPIYFYRQYILQMTQLERFRTQIRQWRPDRYTLLLPTFEMPKKIIHFKSRLTTKCVTAMDEWQRMAPQCAAIHAQGLNIMELRECMFHCDDVINPIY